MQTPEPRAARGLRLPRPIRWHWWDGHGYVEFAFNRRRSLIVGRSDRPGRQWGARISKNYDYRSVTDERCERGSRGGPGCGSRLELRGWSSFTYEWLYCPGCRYRLRKASMIEADAERRRAELGMTRDEFEAHMKAQIVTSPPPPEAIELGRKLAKKYGWGDVKP